MMTKEEMLTGFKHPYKNVLFIPKKAWPSYKAIMNTIKTEYPEIKEHICGSDAHMFSPPNSWRRI
jgi:hypothetical protein